jgi:diguanylate cyclase (GGDEF)-like protein
LNHQPGGLAATDGLTGAYARAALTERIPQEVGRSRRSGRPFALVVFDADHFKSVNDAYGHRRGDAILKELVYRAHQTLRDSDLVFRYGGDEFVLLLPETDAPAALIVAERFREAVRDTPFGSGAQGSPLSLTISAGVAVFPIDGSDEETLFEAADRRSYQAKQGGRDQVVMEDQARPAGSVGGPSRLIERDQASATMQSFLEEMAWRPRGLLLVRGAMGTGRTRFLEETARAAARRQWGVVALAGDVARRQRTYGALDEVRADWHLPLPYGDPTLFGAALADEAAARGYRGVLLTLDDLEDLDDATLSLLGSLWAQQRDLPHLALATLPDRRLVRDPPYQVAVDLEPLSEMGVRTWVRQSLHWEMDAPLLAWFVRETGGVPARMARGLRWLRASAVLTPTREGGWGFRGDLATLTLQSHLERPPSVALHQMPEQMTEFVGREADLTQLKQRLLTAPLVTLLGPGGMGKTRLAVQAAAEAHRYFPDGAYFVPLDALAAPTHIVGAIYDSLGLPMSGPEDPEERLLTYLRDQRLLLVLDNFEHLRPGGEALLARILEQAHGVHLLVTSRDRLGVPSDELAIGGLAYPTDEMTADLEAWTAPQLFLRRARRVRPDFGLDDEETPVLARICRLVDGMPLALELAAAWVSTFCLEAIANRIERNLTFLETEQDDIVARHRHLLAVVDSFWELLAQSEQQTLVRLSVFRGSFEREAARLIAEASPFFLDGLIAKGFLRWVPQGERYDLHELLRQYAALKSRTTPSLLRSIPLTSQAHASYYLELVEAHREALNRSTTALHRLRQDLNNIRVAWQWTVQQRDIPTMQRGIDGMARLYTVLGLWQEGAVFEQAFQSLQGSALARVAPGQTDGRLVLGRLLAVRGELLGRQGRLVEMRAVAGRIGTLAQETDSPLLAAWSSFLAGYGAWAQGELEAARDHLTRAREQSQAAGAWELEADSHCRLGDVWYDLGGPSQAQAHLDASLSLARAHDDRWREARALSVLGLVASARGDETTEMACYQQALAMMTDLGNLPEQAVLLANLGTILVAQGKYAEAEDHLGRALRIYHTCGNTWNVSVALENLGQNAFNQGDLERAEAYLTRSVDLARRIGKQEQYALAYLGLVAAARGEGERARDLSREAVNLARDAGNQAMEAEALVCLGEALVCLGQFEEASSVCEQAVAQFHALGQPQKALEPWVMQVYAPLKCGDLGMARRIADAVWDQLETGVVPRPLVPGRVERLCFEVFRLTRGVGEARIESQEPSVRKERREQ